MSFFVPLQSEFCAVSNSIIIFSGNCIFCKLFYKNTISHVQIRAICQFITIVSWRAILVLQSNRKIKPHFPFTTVVSQDTIVVNWKQVLFSDFWSVQLSQLILPYLYADFSARIYQNCQFTTIVSWLALLAHAKNGHNRVTVSIYNYRM